MFNLKDFLSTVKIFSQKDCIPVENILNSPVQELSELTKKERKVLNYLLYIDNFSRDIYPRQDTIAQYAELSREHVNRTLKKLVSLGLVAKMYRHKTSCLYRTSRWFKDFFIRSSLKTLFSSLSIFSLSLLSIDLNSILEKETSHNTYKGIIYNYTNKHNYDYNNGARVAPRLVSKKREGDVVKNALSEKIEKELDLNFKQVDQLKDYPDKILESALGIVKNTINVTDKVRYFFGICNKKLSQQNKPVSDNSRSKHITTPDKSQLEYQTRPPIYNQYIPVEKKIEVLTHALFNEKSDMCLEKAKNNQFYAFLPAILRKKLEPSDDYDSIL